MEHFNFIKSLTSVVNNITSLPSREGLGLGLGKVRMGLRMLILSLALATFGVNEAWGTKTDYYSKAIVSANPSGGGKVYVAYNSSTKPASPNSEDKKEKDSQESAPEHTYHFWADVNPGYSWSGWTFTNGNPNSSSTQSNATSKITANEKVEKATITATATFTAHTYKVNFYGNGATSGSMSQQTLTYDQTPLTANAFTRSYTVNFDADGGSTAGSMTADYTFNNWNTKADGTGTIYTNQQKNLTTENGVTINLYAQWESAPITLPTSTRSGYVLDGWFSGDTKIGNPGDSYTPTTNISLKAKWTGKYNPDFSYSGSTSYNVGDGPIDLQQLWTSTGDGAITYTKTSFTPESGQQSGSTEPAITDNRYLSLNKAGILKIHLEQAETSSYYAGNADLTITISRIANTLTVEATHTMKIGEKWTSVCSGKNSDAQLSVNNTNEEVATFDSASNTITAHQAGTTTITFSQEATYKYTAKEVSVDVTVNKKDNGFVWNVGGSYNWNQEIKNPFTSNNPNPITCVSNDKNIADYIDGIIYIYNVNGTATFTINQDATDIYNGINETRNVTVTKAPIHLPLTMTSSLYSNSSCIVANEGDNAWDSGIRLGGNSTSIVGGPAYNWDDKYVIIHFKGVPSTLTFATELTSNSSTDGISGTKGFWYVCEGETNGNWINNWNLDNKNPGTVEKKLSPNARYVKICFNGNFAGKVQNLQITERREVKAHSSTTIDFGECIKTADVKQETTYIDWYNVRPLTVSISGENADQFEAVTTSIESSLDNYQENVPVVVKYKHTAAGTHTANLVVSNGTESTTITLKGTSKRQDPVITWKDNLSPLQVNEVVNNPATAGAAVVKYESSDEYFLTVDNTNHTITAVNPTQEGGITLKAYVEEDETWNSAEITCTIEITNLQRQIITWTDKLSRKFTETETISLTATSDAELPITYSLSGEGTYASLSGNQLTITGIGDGLYVTASQAGDETYYPAAMTKHLVVRDPSAACGKVLLADDYSEHTLKTGITSFSGVWTELSWNPANGEPGLLSCEIKEDGGLITSGKMRVEEYYDGDWHEIQSYDVTTSYATKSDIPIQRKSTKVRVGAPTGCTGTHYVKNIEVTQAKYAELSTESIDFDDVSVATKQQRQFTIHYSNLNNSLELALDNENTQFFVDKEFIGEDCGEFGTATVTVTYKAVDIRENETCTLTIKNSEYNKTIALKANVTKTSQTITWNPATTDLLTTDNVQFDATTSASTMGLSVTYSIPEEQQSIATIDASTGQLTIYTAGEISVTVSQEGSDLINPAVPVSKTFTITREIPDITTSPVATTSIRPTTLADLTLQGGEASQQGIFVWTDPTTTLKLGEHAYSVTFIPTNAVTYGENIFNINIVLDNQQQYISWDIEDKDYYCGEIISLASACSKVTANDAATGLQVVFTVDDETLASIDGSELTTLKTGTPKITVGQPGNLTYLPATDVSKTIIIQPNVFTGEGGDDDWNNPANWKAGVPTDETPDASVKGDLTIQSDHKVNIFTIESGASVTIKNGATLTIKGSSAGRETYGDIIVENGGKLVIEETADSVCVQNVYLSTSFGEHSSSQVIAADRLTVHGDAFFDITLADNANAQKWHAFTVPFPVDARKGIYDLDGNQLTNEVNYAIMSYHGDVRAQGKYGWAKFRNIMTPGTFYLMTVDGTIPTFRFRKTTEGNMAATNLLQVAQFPHSGDAQDTDAGWNGIGNSQLSYVSVDAPVQVLDPVSYTYELMEASSTNFTVGTPFFYQAATDGTILLAEPNASAYYAPRRISESEIKNVDVTLSNATYTDHLYLSATDEATAEYQIGRDLVKMTMTATPSVPQIFALAYNASLCMVDAPLTNDEAQVSIRLYAPANGEYTLSVSNDAAADVYLLHNGMPVWNLSESAYTLDLEKGNTEGYSLRLRRAHKQTTDMDAVNGSDKSGVQKVIMDNQLYILRGGQIYTVTGQIR